MALLVPQLRERERIEPGARVVVHRRAETCALRIRVDQPPRPVGHPLGYPAAGHTRPQPSPRQQPWSPQQHWGQLPSPPPVQRVQAQPRSQHHQSQGARAAFAAAVPVPVRATAVRPDTQSTMAGGTTGRGLPIVKATRVRSKSSLAAAAVAADADAAMRRVQQR